MTISIDAALLTADHPNQAGQWGATFPSWPRGFPRCDLGELAEWHSDLAELQDGQNGEEVDKGKRRLELTVTQR